MLIEIDNTGVFVGVGFGDFGGAVGGAVVDKDNFEIVVGLGEDAVETWSDIWDNVVEGDDDRDFGELYHCVSP